MLFNNTLLKESSKDSKTLTREFHTIIIDMINQYDKHDLFRLQTYDLIVNEWLEEGKDSLYDELKYRVTDDEDINKVFLNIIEYDEIPSAICISSRYMLTLYVNEDKYKNLSE